MAVVFGLVAGFLSLENLSSGFSADTGDPMSALSEYRGQDNVRAGEDQARPNAVVDASRQDYRDSSPGLNQTVDSETEAIASEAAGPDRTNLPGEADKLAAARDENDQPEAPPELIISGAVLDDQGGLLPGVPVAARAAGAPGHARRSTRLDGDERRTATDAFGRFTFENLRAAGDYLLSVEDSEDFHGTSRTVRAGVVNAELRVQTIRSVRVHGHILDEHGWVLEGVGVRVLGGHRAASSNSEGAYEITIEPIRAGQPSVLEFQHPDYRSQRQRVQVAAARDADEVRLDLEMTPSERQVAVLGQVHGPRGEPIVDALVWLSSADPRGYQRVRTNQGGEFHFEQVESGAAWRLGVNPGADYEKFISDGLAVGPDDTVYDIRLEASGHGSLSGQLVDPNGRALGHFSLWVRTQGVGGHPLVPVSSDGAGNFEIGQVPAGMLRLESTSLPRLQAAGIELDPGESRHLVVPLDWGEHWLFGQVMDAKGNPIAGARVTLQWSLPYHDFVSSSHRQVGTDLEGFFTFSNLGARNYQVTVQAPGFRTVRREISAGLDEVGIKLQAVAAAGGSK